MQALMPFAKKFDTKIRRIISKQKYFSTLEEFIIMFNNGTINKFDPNVEYILKKLKKYYLNVKVEDDKIIVCSPDEITLDFVYNLLGQWKLVVYLKSLIDRLTELGYPYDTKIVFQTSNPGTVYIEMLDGDTGEYFLEPAHDVPKLFNTNRELAKNLIVNLLLKDYDGGCYLNFEDVEDIDCSFLYEVQEFILQKILIDNHKSMHLTESHE